jgi:hypothetical protein
VVDGRLELEGGYLTMNIAGGLHPVVHLLGRATAQYKGVFADMNNGKSYPSAVFDPHYSFIHLLQTNRCPIPVLESSSTPAGAAVMRVSKVTSNCSLERCVLDFGLQVLAIPHNRDFLTIRCNTLLKCNTRAYRLTAFELGDHVAIHCQLSEQSEVSASTCAFSCADLHPKHRSLAPDAHH